MHKSLYILGYYPVWRKLFSSGEQIFGDGPTLSNLSSFRKSAAITDSLYRAVDVLHSVACDDMDTVADFIKYRIPSILIDLLAAG